MATFKVRKERVTLNTNPDSLLDSEGGGAEIRQEYDVWQQAIFKVGDDCRQDVQECIHRYRPNVIPFPLPSHRYGTGRMSSGCFFGLRSILNNFHSAASSM
jgi:hypothetical protein